MAKVKNADLKVRFRKFYEMVRKVRLEISKSINSERLSGDKKSDSLLPNNNLANKNNNTVNGGPKNASTGAKKQK